MPILWIMWIERVICVKAPHTRCKRSRSFDAQPQARPDSDGSPSRRHSRLTPSRRRRPDSDSSPSRRHSRLTPSRRRRPDSDSLSSRRHSRLTPSRRRRPDSDDLSSRRHSRLTPSRRAGRIPIAYQAGAYGWAFNAQVVGAGRIPMAYQAVPTAGR